jgi:2-polyprenyl-3-methyl-5-hydroxy-6-metoxy-1,4-benzoquinol methylase
VEHYVENPELGHVASERISPRANRGPDPNLPLHLSRYTWALPACEGKRVVDLGCGVGYGTVILSSFARDVVGVDVSSEAIETANELYPSIDYRVTDLITGELPDADVGVCFEVLEHLPQPEKALERFLDAYPRLLVSFPNPLGSGSHINPHHMVDWPLVTLKRKLREAGARMLKVYRQGYYSPAIRRWHAGPSLTWVIDATR